uniref:Uncharacterized protein n=1 Tax=Globodera pallida TaxID=36090 RepID=A0A183BJF7_GLOPA
MFNCSSYFLAMFISSIAMFSRREGVEGIFYRNIPFQYKTAANVEPPKSIADISGTNDDDQIATKGEGGNGIRALLNEIQAQDSRRLFADGDGAAERSRTSFPRRTARLIPLLPSGGSMNTNTDQQQQPLETEMEQQPKFVQQGQGSSSSSSSSSASSLQSLIALRPDYAFKNVADFLRNFFDSRIERSRKNVADDGRTAADWRAARSMQI